MSENTDAPCKCCGTTISKILACRLYYRKGDYHKLKTKRSRGGHGRNGFYCATCVSILFKND